jgi:preprotein translocase subunit SecD
VLFAFGTGPIKGFAVTLVLGIITSLFTAVVCSRVVIDLIWGRRRRLTSLPV